MTKSVSESGWKHTPAVFREAYFPTFVFYQDLPESETLNKKILEAIRFEKSVDVEGITRSNEPRLGGWHSKNELHLNSKFSALTEQILTFSKEVATLQNYDAEWPLAISSMWSIVNPAGSHNKSHVHPGSLWSGVYYVQSPPGAGRISFTDPRTQHLMRPGQFDPNTPRTADNWAEVFFEPMPGRLLLFPSWLYHSVETNLTKVAGEAGDRVIVSFNMYQHSR